MIKESILQKIWLLKKDKGLMNSQLDTPMEHFKLKTFYYYFFNFHGVSNEEPNTFIFGFILLFHGYGYPFGSWKLNLFLDALKEEAIHYFMGLGGNIIQTLENKNQSFLKLH